MSDRPDTVYKVLTADELAALERNGTFAGSPIDRADGYIHLSTLEQLTGTVDKHFAGRDGLHVVAVDLGAFGASLRWEAARGGALFPHLYEALPLSAVIAYGPLARADNDTVKPPVAG